MDFNWKGIHSLEGSQAKAFEELCAQLASVETPDGASFIRKDSPDAGVECFCILTDGSEWGWQAKYFCEPLTQSQWSQLDKSVKTALDKHPALARYYVCIPTNLPDARVLGKKSALDRWNDHVTKWEEWAQERGMSVRFIRWDSFELVKLLSKQSEAGRRLFWFGDVEFNQSWFKDRLAEAIDSAGLRYTPELHIELDIARQLYLFARTKSAIEGVKFFAREIRRKLRGIASLRASNSSLPDDVDLSELLQVGGGILKGFEKLHYVPVGEMPLAHIIDDINRADSIAEGLINQLWRLESDHEAQQAISKQERLYQSNPFATWTYHFSQLQNTLSETGTRLSQACKFVNNRLMIIKGDAGNGKTHSLCDFAKECLDSGIPAVLLLGQWFSRPGEPWTQLLQQVGLNGKSPDELIGALEAAAQASNSRAILIVDALNEGRGPEIWPGHLDAFLSRIAQSPWIGVVISIRSSYENDLLSRAISDRAAVAIHDGFSGQEYEAATGFFSHYGIEFPSTPLLQPEFQRPLFLKILCEGLHLKGMRRMPKGFQGITAVFGLYLDAVNERLAKRSRLDYDAGENLVRKALNALAEERVRTKSAFVAKTRAQELVDEQLPGRTFSTSLYHGLITEGVLMEDIVWWDSETSDNVVSITYQLFEDNIVADFLLRTYIDKANPKAAFAPDGGLAYLCDKKEYPNSGLIGALSIQVPEHTGCELLRIAPKLWDNPRIGKAFLGSIVWRSLDAFSQDTLDLLDELIDGQKILDDPLDSILSISTIPGHYLNATWLDDRLRQKSMAERDSRWSIYLHHTWGTKGPVDRILDWASRLPANDQVEDSVVDLAAITLTWMLTTSNRALRDKVTKALVTLLTGRLESTVRLVARFSNVDDPYVTERLYAAAYGVSMRSHESNEVSELATLVYNNVFGSGRPTAHILLRDYARGVVERAVYLGARLDIDERLIRPPHHSDWPDIPSEESLESLRPNHSEGTLSASGSEWAKHRIWWSVMEDDFARYVIGTNFGNSNWLSLRLDEAPWHSPDERLETLIGEFDRPAKAAWTDWSNAKSGLSMARLQVIQGELSEDEWEEAAKRVEGLRRRMMRLLTVEQESALQAIENARKASSPSFDLSQIQRYVAWRVFDLGWTTERFGKFDTRGINYTGMVAPKTERIGKKYQWIAFYEILAYIADHFQYREQTADDVRPYRGPWQEHLRNTDPSCTVESTPGGKSWLPHEQSWWSKAAYTDWQENSTHVEWLNRDEGLPNIDDLLRVTRPSDGSNWISAYGNFIWWQPLTIDIEPGEADQRKLEVGVKGYLVKRQDADSFMEWAETVSNWGLWMPGELHSSSLFLGEYGWSPAYRHLNAPYYGGGDWPRPSGCPVAVQPLACKYFVEASSDFAVDEGFTLHLPHPEFVDWAEVKWLGKGADYRDWQGKVGAFDPTAHEAGPAALLLREDLLDTFLSKNGLVLCWTISGEKLVSLKGWRPNDVGYTVIAGAYRYSAGEPKGFLNFEHVRPSIATGT